MTDWYDAYDNAHKRADFIRTYERLDFSKGGRLNLCSLDELKRLWKEMYPKSHGFPLISVVQHYFRDCHIAYMYELKAAGRTPDDLRRIGFPESAIRKYWDNRQLAERIVGGGLP